MIKNYTLVNIPEPMQYDIVIHYYIMRQQNLNWDNYTTVDVCSCMQFCKLKIANITASYRLENQLFAKLVPCK